MAFDFEIMYKGGSSNKVADALSRKTHGEVVLSTMLLSSVIDWTELLKELEQDVFLSRLKKDVEEDNGGMMHFSIVDRRLLYKNRVVIPKTSVFVHKLLQEYHDSPVGGHSGELKTYP